MKNHDGNAAMTVPDNATDRVIRRQCELEDLRFFGLRRIKMNEWPEPTRQTVCGVAGTTFMFTAATRSRLPVEELTLQVTGGGLCFAVHPVQPVIYPEEATLLPDVVAPAGPVDFAGNTTLTFLVKTAIPRDFPAGRLTVEIHAVSASHLPLKRRIDVTVVPAVAEAPWPAHTVFWPHWHALCRYHGIAMWSEEFWAMADRYLAESAAGGATGIMLSVKDDPFRYPLPKRYYHHHEKLCPIRWSKNGDGWSFDYSRYDRYIELNFKHGINREIECHSLLPCKCQAPALNYYDANGQYIEAETTFDAPEYEAAWGAFLTDFMRHNRDKGWDKLLTLCPYDEPKDADTFNAVVRMARKYAPDIRITAAICAADALKSVGVLDIATIHLEAGYDRGAVKALREKGVEIRWYNCMAPAWGNTLFKCPLADAYRISWITYANHFAGYLRWSLYDTVKDVFGNPGFNWPTGDMYLLYPGQDGPLASLRWEAYKAGWHDLRLAMTALQSASGPRREHLLALIAEIGKDQAITLPADLGDWHEALCALLPNR